MIESLNIKNFRCFSDLSLDDVGPINIVVGDNGAGKTALLEAIYLSQGGSPELVFKLRAWRALGAVMSIAGTRRSYESIWSDLFRQFDDSQTIEIIASGSPEQARSLEVSYAPVESLAIPLPANGQPQSGLVSGQQLDSSAIVPITFKLTLTGTDPSQVYLFRPEITQKGIVLGAVAPPGLCAFYTSSFASVVPPSEMADQFSSLSKVKKDAVLSKTIRELYPQIRALEVISESGSPLIFCEVRGVEKKIPIGLVSSATHKLVAILLGMATQPNGVVLIDEIDNGFYYKKMSDVWRSILKFAKIFKVQLFVATHSKECLRAALQTIRGNEKMFRLIRMERKVDEIRAKIFLGDELEAAIETDTEFR